MSELEEYAEKYAKSTVNQSDFITIETGIQYAKQDFIAGANWYKEKSKAPEMFEMLEQSMYLLGNVGEFDMARKIESLIKSATEL